VSLGELGGGVVTDSCKKIHQIRKKLVNSLSRIGEKGRGGEERWVFISGLSLPLSEISALQEKGSGVGRDISYREERH